MAYNRKQRLNDNIKAIETAFVLDRDQRAPTARERLLLERYCGFGGLKCILNPAKELTDAVHWAKSDLELFAPTVELHRLIRENSKNESEYKQLMDSLKQSVLTAFYTPPAVTEALSDVLKEHKIVPDKVLEPSAGIGAFVDSILENNPKADVMAFEKDLLTGKILHHLHPEQKVRIEGFEKIEKPFNDYFDLAISNIPFGDVAVFDPSYTAQKGMKALVTKRIHNYFFVKALDTVRDGGLVAFITSRGVLDAKNNSAARFMMLHHADVVSAVRLPNKLLRTMPIRKWAATSSSCKRTSTRCRFKVMTTCLMWSRTTEIAYLPTIISKNILSASSTPRQSWIPTHSANLRWYIRMRAVWKALLRICKRCSMRTSRRILT